MINENLTSWLGHPVEDYLPGQQINPQVYYRFRVDWDTEVSVIEMMAAFTADPSAADITGLVVGAWFGDDSGASSEEIVQLLVGARERLPKLEAIFFGDVISEENEISWIQQSDMSPLFAAYPGLKHFVVRGGNDLGLGSNLQLGSLKSLIVQTGGMERATLDQALSLDLPALERLELWLGTDGYGWTGEVSQLKPLFDDTLFPNLRHLGLRNSEVADAIAEALCAAPIIDRIDSLDLSLGTLTDKGGTALANCPRFKRLKDLDLHYHFMSESVMKRLAAEFPGVNLTDRQELDKYGPYVAIGE